MNKKTTMVSIPAEIIASVAESLYESKVGSDLLRIEEDFQLEEDPKRVVGKMKDAAKVSFMLGFHNGMAWCAEVGPTTHMDELDDKFIGALKKSIEDMGEIKGGDEMTTVANKFLAEVHRIGFREGVTFVCRKALEATLNQQIGPLI